MGTVTATPSQEVSQELAILRQNKHVQDVYSQWNENAFVVWVGISGDDDAARQAVYQLEDDISSRYPGMLFDFHVIALPEGKTTQGYIANAHLVFQRSA